MLNSVAYDVRKRIRDTCFHGSWSSMLIVLKFEKEMTEDSTIRSNYEKEIREITKIIKLEKEEI